MAPSGFEVRELQGGKSSVPFSYRIVAKRVDVAGDRPNAPQPQGPLKPLDLQGNGPVGPLGR